MREVVLNSILVCHVTLMLVVFNQGCDINNVQEGLFFFVFRNVFKCGLNQLDLKLIVSYKVLIFNLFFIVVVNPRACRLSKTVTIIFENEDSVQ